MSRSPLLVGNAQAFWGDDPDAPARLVRQQPDLDFLTLDYLAEVSMSILAIQREKDPQFGFARDFVDVVKSLAPAWRDGTKVRVVTNAGGLNPRACGQACLAALREVGIEKGIAVVSGDDVLPILKKENHDSFSNLETGGKIETIRDRLTTANAYLGADAIARALREGAEIVITGRVADPSLTVGPAMAHFDWKDTDYERIAGATVAGHLIECGTQACGGFATDWLDLPDNGNIGYPIAEISEDGSCVLTKPKKTGGAVNLRTVKEQLLYEVGDPGNYLSPDATVSFLNLQLEQVAEDRVQVRGAKGGAPTAQYKVSGTYRDGFKAHAMITIFGRNAVAKARRAGENIIQQFAAQGRKFDRSLVECLGTGACVPGVRIGAVQDNLFETVLRVSVADADQEKVEHFTKKIAPLVTAGPQGVTGYSAGRPKVQAVFGYWPCLIEKGLVQPRAEMLKAEAVKK